jgi:hypothetical protein
MAGKNAKWGEQVIKGGRLEIQGDAGNTKWTGLVLKNTATHANNETNHEVELSMQMQAYEAGSRDFRPAARVIATKASGNDWYTGSASVNFNGNLYLQVRQNDVMQNALKIDEDLCVTQPGLPSFLATRTVGFTSTGTIDDINFPTLVYNTGSHFDTTTDEFTCPVDGHYLCTAGLEAATFTQNANYGTYILRNGAAMSNQVNSRFIGQQIRATTNTTAVYYFNAGDLISVRAYHSGGTINWDNNGYFGVTLIG